MRIASLSPAATEILFALGKFADIVCTDQFSNFPDEARSIPHVRDHMRIKPEDLSEYRPELLFTCTVIQERLAALLRERGLSVIHHDPRSLHDIYAMIRNIGAILDCDADAEALTLSIRQGFNDVKKKSALLPRNVRVYIEEWPTFASYDGASVGRHELPFASGNWVPEVARFAGCTQFPIPAGELSPQVTLEQVMAFDPDMIVISWCGAGLLADKKLLTERQGWDALRAVRSGQVRVIDDSLLNRPGPRLLEGAQRLYGWAFELLH